MKKINVAVVGLGYWGPNLVRNFLRMKNVHISYICDKSESSLNTISLQYPHLQKTTDFNTLLQDKTVDLIAIATPPSTHFNLAKEALMHYKNVFVEKPMTQTSAQAKILIALAKKNKKVLMIGHTFIYSSAVQKIKEYIDTKRLGELYYYDSTRINLGGFQSDTDVLWDLATHDLAILQYILNERVVSVYAAGSNHLNKKYTEVAHIFIRYTHNIFAHINVSWLSPVKIRTILIGGSKKMILYNDIEPSEKIRIYNNNVASVASVTPFSPAYRSGDIVIPKLSQEETMYLQLTHAVYCVLHNKKPISDGTSGLYVVKLLEMLEKSLSSNKEVLYNEKEN